MDMFDYDAPRYPDAPGFKDQDTSLAAAESMAPTAEMLRDTYLRLLHGGSATADEIAEKMAVWGRPTQLEERKEC